MPLRQYEAARIRPIPVRNFAIVIIPSKTKYPRRYKTVARMGEVYKPTFHMTNN
jgi:hypothetical protein